MVAVLLSLPFYSPRIGTFARHFPVQNTRSRDDAKRIAIECDNPLSKTMASFAVFHPVCVPLGNFMGRNFKR